MDTTITVATTENFNVDEITRIEYKGQLVLTTEQLAKFYGTKVDNIKRNFSNNKDRFIEGKHYFKLEGEELATFKNRVKIFPPVKIQISPQTTVLYLWTKQGAARHCKSVGTDMAWEVFEVLEDNYFNQENVAAVKAAKLVSDFEKGKTLVPLAVTTRDLITKERLVAIAANLILGTEFIPVPDATSAPKMQLTLF